LRRWCIVFDEYVYLDTYQAENELENIESLIDIADEGVVRERIQKILNEIETATTKLNELKRKCEEVLMKIRRPAKTIEEVREEFAEMEEVAEERAKVKLIPEKEAMIVAVSRLPSVATEMKEKARKIIEKYNLTERDVSRLYSYFFGE